MTKTIETTYDNRITPEFIFECAKHGDVRVTTRQVVISNRDRGFHGLDLESLDIPDCFRVQSVYSFKTGYTETLGVAITLVLKDETSQTAVSPLEKENSRLRGAFRELRRVLNQQDRITGSSPEAFARLAGRLQHCVDIVSAVGLPEDTLIEDKAKERG